MACLAISLLTRAQIYICGSVAELFWFVALRQESYTVFGPHMHPGTPDMLDRAIDSAIGGAIGAGALILFVQAFWALIGWFRSTGVLPPETSPHDKVSSGEVLIVAAESADFGLVEGTLKSGISVDFLDTHGGTALIAAVCASGDVTNSPEARDSYLNVARLLLSAGSNYDIRDKFGKTARDYALRDGNEGMLALIDQFQLGK